MFEQFIMFEHKLEWKGFWAAAGRRSRTVADKLVIVVLTSCHQILILKIEQPVPKDLSAVDLTLDRVTKSGILKSN